MVLKFKSHNDDVHEIHLTPEGETLLKDLIHPTEINDTKKRLFNVMHGMASLSVMALRSNYEAEPLDRVYVTRDVAQSIFVIGEIYELLSNIEPKKH